MYCSLSDLAKWMIVMLALTSLCGCLAGLRNPVDEYPNVDHEKFGALSAGLSRTQVEERLRARGAHQFSAQVPQGSVVCVSYYRSDVWGEWH